MRLLVQVFNSLTDDRVEWVVAYAVSPDATTE